jgi:molybdopterin-guanine dinucleotide biosynthesis protein A
MMSPNKTVQIAGVILAGGHSSRMGRDKASLTWKGQSLLARSRELLRSIGCETIIISGKPQLADGVADSEPGAGPGRALLDVLDCLQKTSLRGMLAIPVDMPQLSRDALLPLLSSLDTSARAWHHHPLPVFLPVCFGQIDRSKISSIRDLLNAGPNDRPTLPDSLANCMRNINTPADFEQLGK